MYSSLTTKISSLTEVGETAWGNLFLLYSLSQGFEVDRNPQKQKQTIGRLAHKERQDHWGVKKCLSQRKRYTCSAKDSTLLPRSWDVNITFRLLGGNAAKPTSLKAQSPYNILYFGRYMRLLTLPKYCHNLQNNL